MNRKRKKDKANGRWFGLRVYSIRCFDKRGREVHGYRKTPESPILNSMIVFHNESKYIVRSGLRGTGDWEHVPLLVASLSLGQTCSKHCYGTFF